MPEISLTIEGNLIGPSTSTDNALVRWDGTTGRYVQNSNAILTDSGQLTLEDGLTVDATTAEALLLRVDGDLGDVLAVSTLDGTTANSYFSNLTPNGGTLVGNTYQKIGQRVYYQITSGTQTVFARAYHGQVSTQGSASHSGTGANGMTGFWFAGVHNSTGTVGEMRGGSFQATVADFGSTVATGLVTTLKALDLRIGFGSSLATGSVTDGYLLYLTDIGGPSATRTFTNLTGIRFPDCSPTGVTNGYAIDFDDQTNGYTIRSKKGNIEFGDKVFIDGSQDAIQLLVQGHSTQTNLLAVFENSAGNDQITFGATGGAVFNEQGNSVDFRIEGNLDENLFNVIGASDSIAIGSSTAGFSVGGSSIPTKLSIHNTSAGSSESELALIRYDNVGASYGALSAGLRSRGTQAIPTVVVSGDLLYSVVALGHDGTDHRVAGRIDWYVDGTPGIGDMPGRMILSTTPDGAATAIEALRIDSTQTSYFSGVARPLTNDLTSLGSSGAAWSDLFLASGSVINWNAGDVTLTHSSNVLALTGGSFFQWGLDLTSVSFYQDRYSDNAFAGNYFFRKSRGATLGSHAVVQNGDAIGLTRYYGSDGSAFSEGAQFVVTVDGTPAASDIPMKIDFYTKPASGTMARRIRVRSSGNVEFNNGTRTEGLILRKTSEVSTTDATQTTADSFTLEDENTYHLKARIVGVQSTGANRASYEIDATVYRTGAGVATIQGAITSLHTQESDATWDATYTVSGNDVRVSVTGVAATTIRWGCVLEVVNMSN